MVIPLSLRRMRSVLRMDQYSDVNVRGFGSECLIAIKYFIFIPIERYRLSFAY